MKSLTPTSLLSLIVLLALAAFVRFYKLDTWVATVDDVLVPLGMLEVEGHSNADSLFNRATNPASAWYNGTPSKVIRLADGLGLGKVAASTFTHYQKGAYIASSTTYAPLQFWLTGWLIGPDTSASQALFLMRLPSITFSLLAITLLFLLTYEMTGDLKVAVITGLLFTLGIEHVIMAKQAFSYSVGQLGVVLLLWWLFKLQTERAYSWLMILLTGLWMGIAAMSQYQLLFFWPAILATLALRNWEWHGLIPRVLKVAPAGFIAVVLFLPVYKYFLAPNSGRGVLWNKGFNGEYLFTPGLEQGLANRLKFVATFIFTNTAEVIGVQGAIWQYNQEVLLMVGIVLIVLTAIGYWRMHKLKSNTWFSVFAIMVMAVWAVLILIKQIAWSPSRHSIILVPLVLVPVAYAISWLLSMLKSKQADIAYAIMLVVFITTGTQANMQETEARQTQTNTDELLKWCSSNGVNHIILYGWDLQPYQILYSYTNGKPLHMYFRPMADQNDPINFLVSDTTTQIPLQVAVMGKVPVSGSVKQRLSMMLHSPQLEKKAGLPQQDGVNILGTLPDHQITMADSSLGGYKWIYTDSIARPYRRASEYKPFAQQDGTYAYILRRR